MDEIVIPLQPRSEGSLAFWKLAEVIDGSRLGLETRLDLAVGEGYPTNFRAKLPEPLWTTCGALLGEFTLSTITGASDAIGAQLVGEGIDLAVKGPGVAELWLTGTLVLAAESACDLPIGVDVPIEVSLRVRAVKPSGAAFDLPFGCTSEALFVAPSTGTTGQGTFASTDQFRVALLDETGESMHAANAAWEAQANVRLLGEFAAAHSRPASLAEWVTPPWPQTVEVLTELGQRLFMEVIGGDRITKAEVSFQMMGLKLPMPLEDGATYGEDGWGAAYNRIEAVVSALYVGETGLCSAPNAAWFELESQTPETCELAQGSRSEAGPGHGLGGGVRLVEDGTCTLVVLAPELDSGAGLPAALSATFQNVDALREF